MKTSSYPRHFDRENKRFGHPNFEKSNKHKMFSSDQVYKVCENMVPFSSKQGGFCLNNFNGRDSMINHTPFTLFFYLEVPKTMPNHALFSALLHYLVDNPG